MPFTSGGLINLTVEFFNNCLIPAEDTFFVNLLPAVIAVEKMMCIIPYVDQMVLKKSISNHLIFISFKITCYVAKFDTLLSE